MKDETKKLPEVSGSEETMNTDIYAEYDYIGGMIMKEVPKKEK